jgi:hypothetical protein
MRAFVLWWCSLMPMGRISYATNVPLGIAGALFLKEYLMYNLQKKENVQAVMSSGLE